MTLTPLLLSLRLLSVPVPLRVVVVSTRERVRRHAEGYDQRDSGDYLQHVSTIDSVSAFRKPRAYPK